MAGRRLRDAVKTVLSEAKKEFNGSVHVVIAGLTNTYSQYITTFEEYEVQRYEVSNIFLFKQNYAIQEIRKYAKHTRFVEAYDNMSHDSEKL